MPRWQDGDIVYFIIFLFKILFLPNHCVNYYDYIAKWCSGVACNLCVLLDIGLILVLRVGQSV